jgi:hypothetical protein
LGEGIDTPRLHKWRDEGVEVGEELRIREDALDKGAQCRLVFTVDVGPGGVHFGFTGRLFHITGHALDPNRPGADERLIEEILGVAFGPT